MRFEYKNSFIRSLEDFRSPEREEDIKFAIKRFIIVVEKHQSLAYGFGLKKLKRNYFELRSGLGDRIVFRRQSDLIEFILVGNHDDIKRFLKTI